MDIFTLEPLPARHGDCLLLHYGPATQPRTVLIDGGPSQVYEDFLKDRLGKLAANRPGGPFRIELMMVSHIDDDHVIGLLDFTEEWRNAHDDERSWPWPVDELWHNTFERIAGGDPDAVQASITASFGVANLAEIADREAPDHDVEANFLVLASVAKGARLRRDAEKIGIPINTGFDGLVLPAADRKAIPFDGKFELHVVGPLPDQIEALRRKFATDLPKGVSASLAAYEDESIPNLSSIVVIARYDDKSILLTGDARGDFVLEGLSQQGLLNSEGRLHVDILKLQHHGSIRNTEVDFFQRITADHYVASANGKHENPDRETFELLTGARPKTDRYVIHLTYDIDVIDKARKSEREASIRSALAKHRTPPPTWDDDVDALSTFFARRRSEGFAFEVTTPSSRTTACIDLLTKVSY